jgi:hypothetical protein
VVVPPKPERVRNLDFFNTQRPARFAFERPAKD